MSKQLNDLLNDDTHVKHEHHCIVCGESIGWPMRLGYLHRHQSYCMAIAAGIRDESYKAPRSCGGWINSFSGSVELEYEGVRYLAEGIPAGGSANWGTDGKIRFTAL